MKLTKKLIERAINSNAAFCEEEKNLDENGNIYVEKRHYMNDTTWYLEAGDFTKSQIAAIRKQVRVCERWENGGREKYLKSNQLPG